MDGPLSSLTCNKEMRHNYTAAPDKDKGELKTKHNKEKDAEELIHRCTTQQNVN